MNPEILIVEDDNDINQLLSEILTRNGYTVTQAYSGTEGRLLASQQDYSLILLDLMLPGLTGEELLSVIRKTSNTPVIILSAKDTIQDKTSLLRTGADDYITKPFDSDELLARIEANLRRATSNSALPESSILEYKNIQMDAEAHTVLVDGAFISLTAREFAILQLLLTHPKKVFTKSNLYRSVWGDEFLGDDNTINVHISNLRSKIKNPEYIQTVWGIGFKLQD